MIEIANFDTKFDIVHLNQHGLVPYLIQNRSYFFHRERVGRSFVQEITETLVQYFELNAQMLSVNKNIVTAYKVEPV